MDSNATKDSGKGSPDCPLGLLGDEAALLATTVAQQTTPLVVGSPDTTLQQKHDSVTWRPEIATKGIVNGVKPSGEQAIALSMPSILDSIHRHTGGPPYLCAGQLFVPTDGGVAWLPNTPAFVSFLGERTGSPPVFYQGAGLHTKEDVFEAWKRRTIEFDAVETMPHSPPLAGHFYSCRTPSPGDGKAIEKLLDRFSPRSPVDRDLLLSMIVTASVWGAPGGCRPVFVLTSPDGRGAGKTQTALVVSQVAGGHIDLSVNEQISQTKTRLLSPGATGKRMAILDNVKSARFSWAEFEGLVTSATISGKRNYVGEGQRPNTITYCMTLNGPSLAKDMAQRCILIELSKPRYSGSWLDDTRRFVAENHQSLIADALGFLNREPKMPARFTRWGQWERDILSRLPDPLEAQLAIAERQETTDADTEEAEIVEDDFRRRLERLGYDASSDAVFLPSAMATGWFSQATGEKGTTQALSRRLKQAIDEGTIQRLRVNNCRTWGRGYVWFGDEWESPSKIKVDISERIAAEVDVC